MSGVDLIISKGGFANNIYYDGNQPYYVLTYQ